MPSKKSSPISSATAFLLFSLVFVLLTTILLGAWSFLESKLIPTAGEAPNESVLPENRPTIIIDAGHGGADGGAVSSGGLIEKELNLDIAKKLQALFTDAGYEVIMTRTEDIMLSDPAITSSKKAGDLYARLKIAKSAENAAFISIHMNAFSDSRYSGLQVYYSQNDQRSAGIAKSVQDSVKLLLQPENDRKIKSAGENIYLLNKAPCPAVMIECGFLSNAQDCALLGNEEYRARLADVIFKSIGEYICENY